MRALAFKGIGHQIRELRRKRGLGLKRLALEIGVDPAYLSRIESDLVPPSESVIRSVARVLEIEEGSLLVIAGKLPQDIIQILQSYPDEAIRVLREEFAAYEPRSSKFGYHKRQKPNQ